MTQEEIKRLEKKWTELLKGPKSLNEHKVSDTKKTAAELQYQLLQNEEYQKWLKEKEEVRTALEATYAEDEKPLIEDLMKVGLNITTTWDLVNSKSSYKPAIPILLEHLTKPYHLKNKEGIIRALAVSEAKGIACKAIIDEYNKTPKNNSDYRWAFGNTMAVIMTEDYIDDVVAIVQDKSNGTSRQMFVVALGKVKFEKVENVLINLLDDEEVTLQALEALGRMKSKKAKNKILMLTNNPKALIRKEAFKALKKIS